MTEGMIVLLGGTFDPVHAGHLRVAWEASEALDAEVRLMPAHVPPHRGQPVASVAQRLAILRAALKGQDRLRIDERELRRDGPSFSVDTLTELRREAGDSRSLVLLMGADAFAGLPTWHRWQDLFDLAHIGVLTRPGTHPVLGADLQDQLQQRRCRAPAELHAAPAGRILSIEVTALEISASAIRAQLAAGRQPRYLMPDAVLDDPVLLAPYTGVQSDTART